MENKIKFYCSIHVLYLHLSIMVTFSLVKTCALVLAKHLYVPESEATLVEKLKILVKVVTLEEVMVDTVPFLTVPLCVHTSTRFSRTELGVTAVQVRVKLL